MSIDDVIEWRRLDGRLVVQTPQLKGEHSRIVFVESSLHQEISIGANSRDSDAVRVGQLVRDLDRFSSGALITVGYRKDNSCFMKLLEPKTDEVWEIRSGDPKPSYRLFCSFAKPDVLIVLTCAKREDLGGEGSIAWQDAIRMCKVKWNSLFHPYPPYKGVSASDYIQHNVVVFSDIS